ncbi:MAG: hypothetical protein BWY15_00775 [Firmicutes bacterium ADurb.Bin193]|nr:MAG: hypothetical protein BWY15_00775 [Firmicutes bacterium ADurb.Bin193]
MKGLSKIEKRNRAQGWKHAKLSGHENEKLIENLIKDNKGFQKRLLKRTFKENCQIASISFGGLKETNVEGVLSDCKTKSKTDIYINLSDGTKLNISIKKSLCGQVYLIGDMRFIRGFELQYSKKIPDRVKRAIKLFWGSAPDVLSIIDEIDGKHKVYEVRKHRLVAESLKKYDKNLYDGLIDWFNENICEIIDFCFSRGLAKNENDWADVIWYINKLGENDVDELFPINEIFKAKKPQAEYGKVGGGTTIQLPFGFVQWHQEQMQFHHSYEKIKALIK